MSYREVESQQSRTASEWGEFEKASAVVLKWLGVFGSSSMWQREDARQAIMDAQHGLEWLLTPPVTVEVVRERKPYTHYNAALPARSNDEDE